MSDPVVISGDRKNRSGIVLVGMIKLIVIEFALAVVIHDIAKMIEEGRILRGRIRRSKILNHQFGDAFLVNVLRFDDRASVSNGVKDDVVARLNRRDSPAADDLFELQNWVNAVAGRWNRLRSSVHCKIVYKGRIEILIVVV